MLELVNKIKFYVTDLCNERCVYCPIHGENAQGKASEPLNAKQIAAIAKQAVRLGYKDVKLSGEYGEALTRKDLPEIARAVKEAGAAEISVATNGIGLATRLQSLLDAGVNKFCVSLDTLNRDRYKSITGLDKMDEVKSSIKDAGRALGFRVKVNAVVLKRNADEIDDLIKWTRSLGVTLQLIELYPVRGREEWYRLEHFRMNGIADDLRSQSVYNSRYKPRQMETFILNDGARVEITSEYDDNLFGASRLLVHPDGRIANYDVRETGIALTGNESEAEISEALVSASEISVQQVGQPLILSWGLERPTVS